MVGNAGGLSNIQTVNGLNENTTEKPDTHTQSRTHIGGAVQRYGANYKIINVLGCNL